MLPHPDERPASAPTAGRLRRQVAALRAAPPGDDDELAHRALRAVDPRLGLLRDLGDGGHAQLPLRVAVVTVADPRGGPDRSVLAAGPDAATARVRAVRRGLAAYAAAAVDARRLLAADGRSPLLTGPQDDPAAALAAVAAGRRPARVLGLQLPVRRRSGARGGPDGVHGRPAGVHGAPAGADGLADGADRGVVALDARVAFTLGSPGAGAVAGPPAAGRDWAEAVEAGLLAHCRRLVLAGLGRDGPGAPLLAVDRVRLDPVAARYRAVLAELRIAVTVRDATGPLGVPAYAFEVAGRLLGCAVARRAADALRDGWEQVLLAIQAELHGDAGCRPEPLPPLPAGRRDGRVVPPRRPVARAALAAALHAAGELPVVVPLDHDPEVVRLVPAVLRVVTVPAGG